MELCQLFSKIFYNHTNTFSLWNGYHIYAIDGSTIQIPPSDENINFWGNNPNQYGKDDPLASASLLYDVMNDIIVDSYIGKYRFSERDAAQKHIDFFMDLHLSGKHIFLFDRGYPSYDLFSKLMLHQLHFVMRLPSSFKKLINAEKEDILVQYQQKGRHLPLHLRCIHVYLPDGSIEYLVTNIMDTSFTADTFKELYFLRRGIEGRYKEIKVLFRLESFSGCKPEIIKQDFYSTVFLSNLAALIKGMADMQLKMNEQNKYKYQVNRNFIPDYSRHSRESH
ncbi:MAG: IS4 family transposase [Lachnospiraceae bacterium]|nr:IS4 family transposase [Lachnospiraceae bacterium]